MLCRLSIFVIKYSSTIPTCYNITGGPGHIVGDSPADRNSSASSDADDESHIVDNILGDIRSGFIQKKSFGDSAFTVTKVKKVSDLYDLCDLVTSTFNDRTDPVHEIRQKAELVTLTIFLQVNLDEATLPATNDSKSDTQPPSKESQPNLSVPTSQEKKTANVHKQFQFLDRAGSPVSCVSSEQNNNIPEVSRPCVIYTPRGTEQ